MSYCFVGGIMWPLISINIDLPQKSLPLQGRGNRACFAISMRSRPWADDGREPAARSFGDPAPDHAADPPPPAVRRRRVARRQHAAEKRPCTRLGG